jgi:hypothetical protein
VIEERDMYKNKYDKLWKGYIEKENEIARLQAEVTKFSSNCFE